MKRHNAAHICEGVSRRHAAAAAAAAATQTHPRHTGCTDMVVHNRPAETHTHAHTHTHYHSSPVIELLHGFVRDGHGGQYSRCCCRSLHRRPLHTARQKTKSAAARVEVGLAFLHSRLRTKEPNSSAMDDTVVELWRAYAAVRSKRPGAGLMASQLPESQPQGPDAAKDALKQLHTALASVSEVGQHCVRQPPAAMHHFEGDARCPAAFFRVFTCLCCMRRLLKSAVVRCGGGVAAVWGAPCGCFGFPAHFFPGRMRLLCGVLGEPFDVLSKMSTC